MSRRWGIIVCGVARRPGMGVKVWAMLVMVMAMTGLQVDGSPRSWHDPYPFVALAAMWALARRLEAAEWGCRSGWGSTVMGFMCITSF